MDDQAPDVGIDVHGLTVRVGGSWPEVVEALRRDFAHFAAPVAPDASLHVTVDRRPPDIDRFGDLRTTVVTERNAVFHDGERTVIDYLGDVVSVIDEGGRRLAVEGENGWVARKAAFDFVLSRVGAHLDRIGLPRVHGLGLTGPAGGLLVMLPMGGGKTTLALRALAEPSGAIGFLSEGSPLLDDRGRLHAFPMPLLVRTSSPEAATLPPEHVRRIAGIDPDPLTLEVSAFRDRLPTAPVPLRHVVLGERSLGRSPSLERLPTRSAVAPLLRESVVGFGFFQGIEFLVRGGPRGFARRLGPMRGRAAHCASALRGAAVWRLALSRDKDANWDALRSLLG